MNQHFLITSKPTISIDSAGSIDELIGIVARALLDAGLPGSQVVHMITRCREAADEWDALAVIFEYVTVYRHNRPLAGN